VQERGLSAYVAELIGTFFLVFFITSAVVLYVSAGSSAQFGSDFAVVGLVHAFLLFGLVTMFARVSGGHFNPAVTVAAAALRRIEPIDAVIYMLAQLSGGVLGALLTKGLMVDEGRAIDYGATAVSGILGGNFQGMVVEALGTFLLVLVICVAALSLKTASDWAPLAIGTTLGFIVMVGAPLTGGAFNPARWFGPALISNEWGGVWPYVVGPIVGAILAILVYRLIEPSDRAGVQRPLEPKAMGDIKKDSPAAGAKADPKDSKA